MSASDHVDAVPAIAGTRLDASSEVLFELPADKTGYQGGAERVCATPTGPRFEAG